MQPLSRVKPTANYFFGRMDDFEKRPAVSVKIAQCIAEWADIESMLGIFLALLLDIDPSMALSMFTEVENRSSQMKMVDAAARKKFSQEQLDVHTILFSSVIRPAMRERDRIAHWCWGCSNDLPDALLLSRQQVKMTVHMKWAENPGKLDTSDIFVVTADDLTRTLKRLQKAKDYLAQMMATIWKKNDAEKQAKALQRLSEMPEIETGLIRLRESQHKS